MSLRNDMHAAFDELAPSTAGLVERVIVTTVDARGRRRAWLNPIHFRAPLSLVAVLLLIAIVVAALAGTRLLADWQKLHQQPVHIDQKALQQLESRPLYLPAYKAGAPCTGGPWDETKGWWGSGLVFLNANMANGNGNGTGNSWGFYPSMLVETDPSLQGLVLIRAYTLTVHEAGVFIGDYAAGPVTGSDDVRGQTVQRHSEAVLDTSHPPATRSGTFYQWSLTAGFHTDVSTIPPSGPASLAPTQCTFWQIDTAQFTETMVISF